MNGDDGDDDDDERIRFLFKCDFVIYLHTELVVGHGVVLLDSKLIIS
jgi:hypothetical protein